MAGAGVDVAEEVEDADVVKDVTEDEEGMETEVETADEAADNAEVDEGEEPEVDTDVVT